MPIRQPGSCSFFIIRYCEDGNLRNPYWYFAIAMERSGWVTMFCRTKRQVDERSLVVQQNDEYEMGMAPSGEVTFRKRSRRPPSGSFQYCKLGSTAVFHDTTQALADEIRTYLHPRAHGIAWVLWAWQRLQQLESLGIDNVEIHFHFLIPNAPAYVHGPFMRALPLRQDKFMQQVAKLERVFAVSLGVHELISWERFLLSASEPRSICGPSGRRPGLYVSLAAWKDQPEGGERLGTWLHCHEHEVTSHSPVCPEGRDMTWSFQPFERGQQVLAVDFVCPLTYPVSWARLIGRFGIDFEAIQFLLSAFQVVPNNDRCWSISGFMSCVQTFIAISGNKCEPGSPIPYYGSTLHARSGNDRHRWQEETRTIWPNLAFSLGFPSTAGTRPFERDQSSSLGAATYRQHRSRSLPPSGRGNGPARSPAEGSARLRSRSRSPMRPPRE